MLEISLLLLLRK